MDVINYALFFLLLHIWKFKSDPDGYYEYSPKISREISKHAGVLTTGDIINYTHPPTYMWHRQFM